MAQLQFLDPCVHFALKGKFVDPRTMGDAVELFGGAEKLDTACTNAGLTKTGYVGDATLLAPTEHHRMANSIRLDPSDN